jgi:UDP-N-acetylglucosamine 2-epimerase (non-hydrolysing)
MIAIVLGTRPEIIKMSPVIRECIRRRLDYYVVHTGQHYSYQMDGLFFEELELPAPAYHLHVGSGTHAGQTARIMTGIEQIFVDNQPDVVLVQGDTNTVLGAALTAAKLEIPVGHVEAGLRSYDRAMPEETNRVITDHISDYLFAPTEAAMQNLLREGIEKRKIYLTGNTVLDAVYQNLEITRRKKKTLDNYHLRQGEYFLATAHRAENVDYPSRLEGIINGLALVGREYDLPVIFPVHPRTSQRLDEFGIDTDGISRLEPIGYLEFLQLEGYSKLVLTDSGGVQEEACILGVPCVTLRQNTERPETLSVGSNVLAGTDSMAILDGARRMLNHRGLWQNPFGDGASARIIVDLVV